MLNNKNNILFVTKKQLSCVLDMKMQFCYYVFGEILLEYLINVQRKYFAVFFVFHTEGGILCQILSYRKDIHQLLV